MGNREPGITLNNAAGEQLDKARRVRRMTFEELGARSGIAKNSAHRYLHGERVINMVTLESLCLALDVAPAAIIATAARNVDGLADLKPPTATRSPISPHRPRAN